MLANNAQLQKNVIQRTRLFFRAALLKIGGNIACVRRCDNDWVQKIFEMLSIRKGCHLCSL